jgi:hypothetical protein
MDNTETHQEHVYFKTSILRKNEILDEILRRMISENAYFCPVSKG